jgi:hypothetical protein
LDVGLGLVLGFGTEYVGYGSVILDFLWLGARGYGSSRILDQIWYTPMIYASPATVRREKKSNLDACKAQVIVPSSCKVIEDAGRNFHGSCDLNPCAKPILRIRV